MVQDSTVVFPDFVGGTIVFIVPMRVGLRRLEEMEAL